MWNAGIPYILKQLIDVISQPGMVFGVDPRTGYSHLFEGRDKKAAVIYTSAVWAPGLSSAFGSNFQSTYFEDWLRWTGITDITQDSERLEPDRLGDHIDALHSAACALSGWRHDAEDLVQETFAQVLDPGSSAEDTIFGI